ncbi:MAG: hypothetical protein ABI432_05820 [Flavobacteriales bacterium]
MRTPASLIIIAALVSACGSTRKAMESAAVYEREGMYQEAHDQYADIYEHKPKMAEARVGMKHTAQALFDRLQDKASALYMANDLNGGDRARQEALHFQSAMEQEGLEMTWNPLFEQRRTEARQYEADRLYQAADAAFRIDRFTEAEDLANQSLRLDPDRKETAYLVQLAELEPHYRHGKRAMETNLWRSAFTEFKRVTDADIGYKDAWALQDQCRGKAECTLAYVPIYNGALYVNNMGTGEGQLEAQLAANVKQALLDLNDPLLIMVDRDNTDQLLAEQQRQMSGVYDDRYVAEAGKLLGARYVLTGKILRFDDVLRKEIEVQMQVIDTETGRIHVSEIVRVNKQEIIRGGPRTQLLERSSKRIALRLAEFDPFKR